MNFIRPVPTDFIKAGQSYTANISIGSSPMVLPSTTNTGCFIISAQGATGPNVVAIITKSDDSQAGDVAIVSASNDASNNYFDILWPVNSRPTISCTAITQTKIFISNGGATNVSINAAGSFSQRSNYDNKPDGFVFFDDTNKCFYIRKSAVSGTWTDALYFPAKSDGERTAITEISSTLSDIPFTDTTGNFMVFVNVDNGPSSVFMLSKGISTQIGDMMALSASPDNSNNYLSVFWASNSKPQISFPSTVTARVNVTCGGYYPPTRDEVIKYMWAFTD